jgi:hypothetical protein
MTASDDEFEDFLRRRKHKFRPPDDVFGPPEELDRVVLRQAREAIETPRPVGVFRGPRWATPVALAATLVLAVGVVFHAGMPQKREPVAEVSVQSVAQRVDYPSEETETAPAAAPAPSPRAIAANKVAREAADASGTVVVDLAAPAEADRFSPPPAAAPVVARRAGEQSLRERSVAEAAADSSAGARSAPAAIPAAVPDWRRDTKSWLAEIERLRNAGDTARADAELAEYKRQQRAYAGAPDR